MMNYALFQLHALASYSYIIKLIFLSKKLYYKLINQLNNKCCLFLAVFKSLIKEFPHLYSHVYVYSLAGF